MYCDKVLYVIGSFSSQSMEFIRKSNFPKKVFHLHFDLIKLIYFCEDWNWFRQNWSFSLWPYICCCWGQVVISQLAGSFLSPAMPRLKKMSKTGEKIQIRLLSTVWENTRRTNRLNSGKVKTLLSWLKLIIGGKNIAYTIYFATKSKR